MSDQSDTFGGGSILIHVALHGFPAMTVEDDDPLYILFGFCVCMMSFCMYALLQLPLNAVWFKHILSFSTKGLELLCQ